MFDRKILVKALKWNFDPIIYHRGEEYYGCGQVDSLKAFVSESKSQIAIRGQVAGNSYRSYRTSFVIDLQKNKFNNLRCDCPYGDNCKHLAALGLEAIDILEQFSANIKNAITDVDRDALIAHINRQKLARGYKGGKDDNDEYFEDNEDDSDDEYIDGEFEEIEDTEQYQKMTKQQLLDELRVWASIGDAPDSAIGNVVNELARRGLGQDGAALNKNKLARNIHSLSDHQIILEHRGGAELDRVKIISSRGDERNTAFFLHSGKSQTLAHRRLLQFIDKTRFYYGHVDYRQLFGLLEKSGLKVYWNKVDKNREMDFGAELSASKIRASLRLEKIKDYHGNKRQEFVFRLDPEYREKKFFALLAGNKEIIRIEDGRIIFHALPAELFKIISRIRTDEKMSYLNSEPFETRLNEGEIVKLDRILALCREYFDFTANLKDDPEIIAHNRFEPCFVINYDSQNAIFDLKVMIDYGCDLKNVGQNVSCRRRHGKEYFESWG